LTFSANGIPKFSDGDSVENHEYHNVLPFEDKEQIWRETIAEIGRNGGEGGQMLAAQLQIWFERRCKCTVHMNGAGSVALVALKDQVNTRSSFAEVPNIPWASTKFGNYVMNSIYTTRQLLTW
jgi:hypothetical protein